MKKTVGALALMPFVALLSACGGGGGGGTSVTLGGFTSWSAVKPNSTANLSAISREATYEYDLDAEAVTSLSAVSATTTGSTLSFKLDGNSNITGVTVTTPTSTVSLSASAGDSFVDTGGGVIAALSADETKAILAIDPSVLGWDYQTFGVWETGIGTGSGTIGALSAGAVTPASAVPKTGTAAYSGMAAGFFIDAAGVDYGVAATLTVNADFASRSLAFATSNTTVARDAIVANAGLNLSGTLAYASGSNTFSGDIATANGMTGRADGRFYGPAAEEIGGVFAVTGAGLATYGGAFGGKR